MHKDKYAQVVWILLNYREKTQAQKNTKWQNNRNFVIDEIYKTLLGRVGRIG